jgi:hypothetical protein
MRAVPLFLHGVCFSDRFIFASILTIARSRIQPRCGADRTLVIPSPVTRAGYLAGSANGLPFSTM